MAVQTHTVSEPVSATPSAHPAAARRRLLCGVSAMMLLLSAIPAQAAGTGAEQEKLAGMWTAVAAQRDGAAADELLGHKLVFDGDRFDISVKGKALYSGTYTVKPSAEPAQIDFHLFSGNGKGKTWEGIYKIDGNTLTVCDDAPDPAGARPTGFTAMQRSGHVLITFRRT